MRTIKHFLGLALALVLAAGAVWAWSAYPDFLRLEPVRPWRGFLTTWRIPIFGIGIFMVLSLLQWLGHFWQQETVEK